MLLGQVEISVAQVEFANIIILNKLDLVSEADKERVRLVVEELNPDAKVGNELQSADTIFLYFNNLPRVQCISTSNISESGRLNNKCHKYCTKADCRAVSDSVFCLARPLLDWYKYRKKNFQKLCDTSCFSKGKGIVVRLVE